MKHISKIQREYIPNILISEVMDGGRGIIRQKLNKIDLMGQGLSITTEVTGDGDTEAIKEHMKQFGEKFFRGGKATEVELHVLYPDLEKYLFSAQPIFLEKARVTIDGAGSAFVDPSHIIDAAPTFGMVSVPMFQPPTCLLYALHQGDKDEINDICESFTNNKSIYGKIDVIPSYIAVLGLLSCDEDADLKWSMEAK